MISTFCISKTDIKISIVIVDVEAETFWTTNRVNASVLVAFFTCEKTDL